MPQTMNDLEKSIKKRIREFEIIPLLHLLKAMGYTMDEIRFQGQNSICSQDGMIDGIRFRQLPVRDVEITLNMGLLSAQSPLPSYFRKTMESSLSSNSHFTDFIGFFDHHLLVDYICNIYPEINRFFYPSWEDAKQRLLQVLDLKSCSTLHWLFQLVFPEIGLQVEKALLSRSLKTIPIRVGKTRIGSDAVFGKRAIVPIYGSRITLFSEEEMTETRIPWPEEIKNRLIRLIYPVLRPTGIDLEINLVLKSQRRWARLHAETYLGYDRIRNGHISYRRVRIFRGHIDKLPRLSGNGKTKRREPPKP